MNRLRRLMPAALAGMSGLACLLCCAIPILLSAGILGGAGWAVFGHTLPGIAVVAAALAGLTYRWTRRRTRHRGGCAGGSCSCALPDSV